jgi:hypothetical protein
MINEMGSINQRFQADASFQPSLSGRVSLCATAPPDSRMASEAYLLRTTPQQALIAAFDGCQPKLRQGQDGSHVSKSRAQSHPSTQWHLNVAEGNIHLGIGMLEEWSAPHPHPMLR